MTEHIYPHKHRVPRSMKEHLLSQKSRVLWFTGLSGSGKSTIANATEYALKNGVIIVTPGVLFAYLSTINHAMKVFYIEENVKELVEAFKAFKKEWETYTDYYEEVQKSLDATQERFDLLVDRRTKALNRKVDAMDELSVDGSVKNLEE